MGDNFYLFLFETSVHYIIPPNPCSLPQKNEIKITKGGRRRKPLVGAKGNLQFLLMLAFPFPATHPLCFFGIQVK